MIKAIFFDCGGIIWNNNWDDEIAGKIATLLRIKRDDANEVYKECWPKLKIGKLKEDDFWKKLVKKSKKEVPIENIKKLYYNLIKENRETLDFVKDLSKDYFLYTLNNETKEWMDFKVEEFKLREIFKDFYCSAYLKSEKSDKLFEKALEKSGFKANEVLFIDDKEEYVEKARQLGFNTLLFKNLDYLRMNIDELKFKSLKIKRVLYCGGKKFYWKKKHLHTNYGALKEEDILLKRKVKTSTKKEFSILDANFADNVEKLERGPAIITNKDIGLILTNTGIGRNSSVLDAGTGSGFLTAYLSNFCKTVYSYEKNKDFFKLAKKNLDFLGIENVVLKNKDVYKNIDEINLDLITLDLDEPWKVLKNAKKSLKDGAYFVAYLPTVKQIEKLVNKSRKDFVFVKVVELLEREWHFDHARIRPFSRMIGHTAFLVFLRKI